MDMKIYLDYWKGILTGNADNDANERHLDKQENQKIQIKTDFIKNRYHFTCEDMGGPVEWNIIQRDNKKTVKNHITKKGQLTVDLQKGHLYLVDCNSKDRHGYTLIDRRNKKKSTDIRLLNGEGLSFIAEWERKRRVQESNLIWEAKGTNKISFQEFQDNEMITATVPKPGIWEISCRLQKTNGRIIEKRSMIAVFSREGAVKIPSSMGLQDI